MKQDKIDIVNAWCSKTTELIYLKIQKYIAIVSVKYSKRWELKFLEWKDRNYL